MGLIKSKCLKELLIHIANAAAGGVQGAGSAGVSQERQRRHARGRDGRADSHEGSVYSETQLFRET